MKYPITEACEAVERAIESLKEAGQKAKLAGDRPAERNVGENSVADLKVILNNLRVREGYILQSRYVKYFDK